MTKLMSKIAKKVKDRRLLLLVRCYLRAGVNEQWSGKSKR